MIEPAQSLKASFPWKIGVAVLWDAIRLKQRSLRCDSLICMGLLSLPTKILEPENVPRNGPALLVLNHYSRPGFGAWWIAVGINALMSEEVHWMMTAGWNHAGLLNPVTRWLFPRLAYIYGFTVTPPLPPSPKETETRARAVRTVLKIAKNTEAIIAIAPEGQDHPKGILGVPPAGVGRFLVHLSKYRERITPIGVFEDGTSLCFHFGAPFQLDLSSGLGSKARGRAASQRVMEAIASLLPLELRGEYG